MEVFNIDAKVVYEGFKAVVLRDEFEKACMDVALDALRKQIPRKPENRGGAKQDGARTVLYCPKCRKGLRKGDPFCHHCGQAIDRSGEDVTADC